MGSPGRLPSSPLPSPPPLHPEPTAESERKDERERERTLGTAGLAFPHLPVVRSHVGYPGAGALGKSTATEAVLEQLAADRLLPMNVNSQRPAWISPRLEETEPNPPEGYVVSLVRLHERGFGVIISRLMRALCEHYGAELHNFGPNSIL